VAFAWGIGIFVGLSATYVAETMIGHWANVTFFGGSPYGAPLVAPHALSDPWATFQEPFTNSPPRDYNGLPLDWNGIDYNQQYMMNESPMLAAATLDTVPDTGALSGLTSTPRAQEAQGRPAFAITGVGGPQPIGALSGPPFNFDAPVSTVGANSTFSNNSTFKGGNMADQEEEVQDDD